MPFPVLHDSIPEALLAAKEMSAPCESYVDNVNIRELSREQARY
jgi:hypothetical protein